MTEKIKPTKLAWTALERINLEGRVAYNFEKIAPT